MGTRALAWAVVTPQAVSCPRRLTAEQVKRTRGTGRS